MELKMENGSNSIQSNTKMKNDYKIQKIEISGVSIMIDHEQKEIVFPEDITDERLEGIAYYLHEEGFLEQVSK